MTLLVSLRGPDYSILLSDRRLTAGSKRIDDEANKATVVTFEDAKLACAFTGIARAGRFSTTDLLLDCLSDSAPPDFLSVKSLQRLRDRLSREFSTNRHLVNLAKSDKRLAILFSGFHYSSGCIFPVAAVLTNFRGFAGQEDLPFEPTNFVLREINMDQYSKVGFAGAWPAMDPVDVESLNRMLNAGKPAKAVINKAIDIFHRTADRQAGATTIGGQLTSITIWAKKNAPTETAYHVRQSSPIVYSPNIAHLTRKSTLIAKGGLVYQSDRHGNPVKDARPMAVPKVHRNAPCPCGSNIRYRNCHGKRS